MRLDYGPCIVQDAAIIEFENQVHITNFKIKENQTLNKQPGWNASCPSYWGEKSTTVKKKQKKEKISKGKEETWWIKAHQIRL